MIAVEWMEPGWAIIRGFVTPDRTTLIASTHRNLAVGEKMIPGDGIADATAVHEVAEQLARRRLTADFEAAAVREGSVTSTALSGRWQAAAPCPSRARPRRLVKGCSDTHGRGLSKYDRVLAGIDPSRCPGWVRRLREAALLDEEGKALDGAIRTQSFAVVR